MFLLDILDNMPHLRLSDDHMRSVLWMLRELDVPDTPSFYALRETQKKLADEMDIQPRDVGHRNNLCIILCKYSPPEIR